MARRDPLTAEVLALLTDLSSRFNRDYEAAAAKHQLTGVQAKVLALLEAEPLPMRDIADRLACEPSNVTGIIDRLEARALVSRQPDPGDRRVKQLVISDEARSLIGEVRADLDFAAEPLGSLSVRQRTDLRDLLVRIAGS